MNILLETDRLILREIVSSDIDAMFELNSNPNVNKYLGNNHINFHEIGYRLKEKHWGNRYGFESAKAWLDYGFKEMKIPKMYASAHKENTGYIRILYKTGMKIISEYDWNGIPCYWFELENNIV